MTLQVGPHLRAVLLGYPIKVGFLGIDSVGEVSYLGRILGDVSLGTTSIANKTPSCVFFLSSGSFYCRPFPKISFHQIFQFVNMYIDICLRLSVIVNSTALVNNLFWLAKVELCFLLCIIN